MPGRELKFYMAGWFCLVVGLTVSWHFPGTVVAAVFGWISALGVVLSFYPRSGGYLGLLLSGTVIHLCAFHWLYGTISDFGGFPPLAAAALFLFFSLVSSTQLLIGLFLSRRLPTRFSSLRIPIGWCLGEFIGIRIFPWALGHSQIAFTPFVQSADIFGDWFVGFLMLALIASFMSWVVSSGDKRPFIFASISCLLALFYGAYQRSAFLSISGPVQNVALVQGNVTIEEKHNVKYLVTNREKYRDLSIQALNPDTLIVWPESVIQEFIPTRIGSAMHDPRIPYWSGSNASLLVGSLTAESRTKYFNSALAIRRDGSVPNPYHKRILMPFGEYTPLGDIFPFIQEMNQSAANFTPGDRPVLFDYPMGATNDQSLKVSPLICYEDIVPNLAREAAKLGAELLVSLSNDAWFGNSIAARQHNVIAAFRAIETKRYLLRATNSGLTAIVNPLGVTISELPTFTEGVLSGQVVPMSWQTPVVWLGELPRWTLLILALLAILLKRPYRWLESRV